MPAEDGKVVLPVDGIGKRLGVTHGGFRLFCPTPALD